MSFDYISDLFGKSKKSRKTKFTDVENLAKQLMTDVYSGRISYDSFFEGFGQVIVKFRELCGDVIDENTPLWLNSFSANVFLRWRNWHMLRKAHSEHPEKFNTPELESEFKRIESMKYDAWLKDKIKYCLDNV